MASVDDLPAPPSAIDDLPAPPQAARPQGEPDMGPMGKYIQANLAAAKQEPQGAGSDLPAPPTTPKPAESMLDALEAGFQMSAWGLVKRDKLPDTVLPQDAPIAMRIASQAGTLAGDLPAMVAGGVFGGIAGSEVPVVGNAMGAAYGAWAAPAAIRSAYIQALQKGHVQSFGDFFERAGGVFLDQLKAGLTGVATEGVGGLAEGALAKTALSPAAQITGKLGAQLATMTTVSKAMDGQMPTGKDFLDGAILLVGFHGVGEVAGGIQTKLQEIYAKTGIRPEQVVKESETNPMLKQEVLSTDAGVPPSLKDAVEKAQPNQELFDGHKPTMVDAEIPKELGEKSGVLGEGFDSKNVPQVEKPVAPEEPAAPAKESETTNEEPTARDKILSRIGEPEVLPAEKGWDNWYTKVVDKLNPLAKLRDAITGGAEIPKGEDPYALMSTSLSRGFAQADEAINTQMRPILEQFKDDPNGFKAYGLAKRALERESKGFATGFDLDAAKQYVDENKGTYEKSFQKLVDFQNQGLEKLHNAGFFSEKQYAEILENSKDYFPLRRVMEPGESSGGVGSKSPIKGSKGSERAVIDPFEQIIKNQYAYYRLAEENSAKLSVVKLAEKNEAMGSDLIERVKPSMAAIDVTPEEINKYLTKYGIHEGDPEAMTIFRPQARPLAEDQMSVMRNGKQEIYSVDPSVAKALSASAYQEPNMIMKAANVFATAQRVGITENPFFLLKHAIRDQFTATIQSQNGYHFAYDGLRGLAHYFAKSDDFMEFLRNGGGMSTLADFDKQYVKPDVWGLSKETGLLDKSLNIVKTPFELMHALAEATFTAPKMGEYLRAREAGKDAFTAAYEGRNVTIDAQKMGSSDLLKAWSAATPFMNMRIRGMDQMVDSFQRDLTGTATKMALGITLTSLATWWAFKDDERYSNAPNWEKDLYWILPIGSDQKTGATLRIPKPFEPGLLFGSLAERTMAKYYDHNPEAFKGFPEAVFGDALPNLVPPALMPILEQFGNRSWLTGQNIVPDRMTGVAPEYQYTHYTSETAKKLSNIISYIPRMRDIGHKNVTVASPMIIENYIRAWTGETGMYALGIMDKALEATGVVPTPVKPASTLSDIPYIKQFFVRYPSSSAQSVQDFYDAYSKAQTRDATIAELKKSGDVRAMSDYIGSDEGQQAMVKLSGIAQTMSTQNKFIQWVYQDQKMTPNDKRQLIDGAYYQMIQASQYGNKLLHAVEKQ